VRLFRCVGRMQPVHATSLAQTISIDLLVSFLRLRSVLKFMGTAINTVEAGESACLACLALLDCLDCGRGLGTGTAQSDATSMEPRGGFASRRGLPAAFPPDAG